LCEAPSGPFRQMGPVPISPRDAYLQFLSGGCSKDPLDLLRAAGVDMEQPGPIDAALKRFGELVNELDRLV